jgi:hypothetical protein
MCASLLLKSDPAGELALAPERFAACCRHVPAHRASSVTSILKLVVWLERSVP